MSSSSGLDSTDAKGLDASADDTGQKLSASPTGQSAQGNAVGVKRDVTVLVDIVHKRSEAGESTSTDAKIFQCLTPEPEMKPKEVYKPSVSALSDSYDMEHTELGHALIINQEQFSVDLRRQGYSRRTGTAVDERNISRRLKHLGFRVTSYPDLTGNQMKNVCKKMADQDHTNFDCFVCVLLSHGEEGIVFGTDKPVQIKDLSDCFKADRCPTLVGKPKIFIIQACRGLQTDSGVKIHVTPDQHVDETDGPSGQTIKLPVEADFLFAYSTVPGYFSWRNGANGSWFIQALCETLEKMGESLEIRKLLTIVNRKVAQNFQSCNPDNAPFHEMKQIPCITSMLTKDLFLRRKKRPRQSALSCY